MYNVQNRQSVALTSSLALFSSGMALRTGAELIGGKENIKNIFESLRSGGKLFIETAQAAPAAFQDMKTTISNPGAITKGQVFETAKNTAVSGLNALRFIGSKAFSLGSQLVSNNFGADLLITGAFATGSAYLAYRVAQSVTEPKDGQKTTLKERAETLKGLGPKRMGAIALAGIAGVLNQPVVPALSILYAMDVLPGSERNAIKMPTPSVRQEEPYSESMQKFFEELRKQDSE